MKVAAAVAVKMLRVVYTISSVPLQPVASEMSAHGRRPRWTDWDEAMALRVGLRGAILHDLAWETLRSAVQP